MEQIFFAASRVLSRMLWYSSRSSRSPSSWLQSSAAPHGFCTVTNTEKQVQIPIKHLLIHLASCCLWEGQKSETTKLSTTSVSCSPVSPIKWKNPNVESLCDLWGKILEAQERAITSYKHRTSSSFQGQTEVWGVRSMLYTRDFPLLSLCNELCWERPTWNAAWILQNQSSPSCQMQSHW